MKKDENKTWEEIGRALYEEWANRPAFSYTPTRDPAYTAVRDAAVHEARIAATDAEARAAARTGGYGSSYAAEAGDSAYESSMRALDGVIPSLYELAYGRYEDEGEELLSRLEFANENAEREAKEASEAAAREEKEREEKEKAEAEAKARAEAEEKKRNEALLASPLWPMGYKPSEITVPEGEWFGVNENEAVAVMLKAGVADHVVEALVPRGTWSRNKTFHDRDGVKDPNTYGYKNYEEYLCAYVNTALGMLR